MIQDRPLPTGNQVDTGTLLRIEGLRTELDGGAAPVHAVDGVTFDLAPGECLGLVGESGCGKSMTAFSIMQLLPAAGRIAGGQVLFDGQRLDRMTPEQMRAVRGNEIGIVFQDPMTSLNPTMTIYHQVSEPLRLHRRMSEAEMRARVIETLELVGLPHAAERLDSFPHELSGGQRQRVCIAVALVCRPRLLIADEPTTALDVTIQGQILELIDDLRREFGMAVILVTHDLGVIAGHTDRVAVMYAGQVVETATTADILEAPRHRYTEGLFRSLPERAAGPDQRLFSIAGLPPDLSDPPPGCRFAARCHRASDRCRTRVPPRSHAGQGHDFHCFHPVAADPAQASGPAPDAPPASVAPSAGAVTPVARPRDGAEAGPAVSLQGVVREYELVPPGWFGWRPGSSVKAVSDVSFDIPRGGTFGLVGESGCGKSTISRLVAGLDRPSAGRIEVTGTDLAALSRRGLRAYRDHVQLVFQDPSAAMDGRMRVNQILREPLEVRPGRGPLGGARARILDLMDQVGLSPAMYDRYPHEMSGGQRQRLSIARALALEPDVIVADEPVSALDVSIQAQILNLMKDLQRDRGLSYLFVTHDLSVVRYMSDIIGVMYLGKLVEVGPAEDVYARPRHPYTRGLVDAVPRATRRTEPRVSIRGELPSAIRPPSGCRFRTRCPLAQEVCARVEPALERAAGPRAGPQKVACHFPLDQGEGTADGIAAGAGQAAHV